MSVTQSLMFMLIAGFAVVPSANAGDVVVEGNISSTGVIVGNGGFQFPDSSVQLTASFPEHKRIVIVSPLGSASENGAALLSAIAEISPSVSEPYMLKIEPGVYDVGPNQIYNKEYLDIEGAGQALTRIKGTYPAVGARNGFFEVEGNSELRMLTVENYGGGASNYTGIQVFLGEANVRLSDITVLVNSGTQTHTGVEVFEDGTVLRNVTVTVKGGGGTVGLVLNSSDVVVDGANIRAVDGSYGNWGVVLTGSHRSTIMNAIIEASGTASSENIGLDNRTGSSPGIFNSTIRAFGASNNYAIYNNGATLNGGDIEIHNSRLSGENLSVLNESSNNAYIAVSQLKGLVSNTGIGGVKCVGAYNEDFNSLNNSCSP